MKTKVELKEDVHQSELKKGMVGYIDGYVVGGDGRPYAVVVSGQIVDMCPMYNLKVIGMALDFMF